MLTASDCTAQLTIILGQLRSRGTYHLSPPVRLGTRPRLDQGAILRWAAGIEPFVYERFFVPATSVFSASL